MSAIVCIFNRDGKPVTEEEVHQFLKPLDHYGQNGKKVVVIGNIGIGFQHFWTTPEDSGIQQPIYDHDGQYLYAFTGRIDNRDELTHRLGVTGRLSNIPDVELARCVFNRWGGDGFARVIGSFTFLFADLSSQSITIIRDALGDHGLFYTVNEKTLLIASEPTALLSRPEVSTKPDEVRLATFFAQQWPTSERSFFRDITELLPAHWMTFSRTNTSKSQYWRLPTNNHRIGNDQNYAEEFRTTLDTVVKAQLRTNHPVALSLSGGLDSTSIAVSAQQHKDLAFISWIFDDFPQCDERQNIASLRNHFSVPFVEFSGDNSLPLMRDEFEICSAYAPQVNMYNNLKQCLYQESVQHGYRIILNGDYGDNLYLGELYWLRDLLRNKQLHAFFEEFVSTLHLSVFKRDKKSTAAIRRILPFNAIRSHFKRRPPPWLTAQAKRFLPEQHNILTPPQRFELDRYESGVSMYVSNCEPLERRLAALSDVERRSPFRDRRMVEFMLSLPAHYLYLPGKTKAIARDAMVNRLPRQIVNGQRVGMLYDLFEAGLHRADKKIEHLLWGEDADWQRFVCVDTLPRNTHDIKREHAVLFWYCISYEIWKAEIAKVSAWSYPKTEVNHHPNHPG